jgi:hypothetical protein
MRKSLAAATGAFSVAAMIAGSSMTAATASPVAAQTEYFRFVSGLASGRASAVATGAFTAGGSINLNTKVGTLRFPGGTFQAFPHPTHTVTQLSRRSCLLKVVQHGTYRVGRGTGRFAHIGGSGRFVAHILAVLNRNAGGKCSQTRKPQAIQQVVTAHGPVHGV